MKFALIALALLSFAAPASAAKGAVYCKDEGRIYNALSDEGHEKCAYALMTSDACFTGSRAAVIELINENDFNWGGEEWLSDAHFKGTSSIAYTFEDGVNNHKEKQWMDRCPADFFKR